MEARINPLLSRRDWVYLLSLLVPFVVADMALEVYILASQPDPPWLRGGLALIRADFSLNLGYALFWIGLFAAARKGLWRRAVVVLFHLLTLSIALTTVISYQYLEITGTTLDSEYLLFWLAAPEGTGGVIASQVTPISLALLLAISAYAVLGPTVATRLVEWWRGWGRAGIRSAKVPWLRLAGVVLTAYALLSFSLLPGGGVGGISFSRDAVANVALTAAEVAESGGPPEVAAEPAEPPPEASLQPTSGTEKRNVVLILLESTRSGATTPYNEELGTTPFMDELTKQSLVVEQARAVVTHSTNAYVATNCGVEPPLDRWGTLTLGTRSDSIPSTCLAELLKEQGYDTAWFTSSTSTFERQPEIVQNMGYEEYYPVEGMDKEGFEQANYFGYEDDVMLEPSKEWLTEQKGSGKPFLATYATITPHHEYQAPQERYGRKDFAENDVTNRYLNAVRYQDMFLKNLFDQYKELGLYEDTVFVILGDHGQAFGEHGRFQHDNVPYEEGLKVPMLVHDPRRFQDGARVEDPVDQLDVLPTAADLLGYEIEGGEYGGRSFLDPLPEDRVFMSSCWNESGCMTRIEGTEKYIYHFDNKPEEVFDLSADPGESRNLAGEYSSEELEKRRRELLEWRAKVNSMYGTRTPE